jgi:hypothetical protein
MIPLAISAQLESESIYGFTGVLPVGIVIVIAA